MNPGAERSWDTIFPTRTGLSKNSCTREMDKASVDSENVDAALDEFSSCALPPSQL
jgi:hypothetical protein